MKHPMMNMLALITLCGALSACSLPTPPGAPTTLIPAVAPPQANQIVAEAKVVPQRYVELSFNTGGVVSEVLVHTGDLVQAGAALAQLDTRDLELQVAQNQASVAQAQASYAKIMAGATKAEIAAQQALVRNAQAQLDRSRSGNITAADIASAQAQLRAAQARLSALKKPSPANTSSAQLRVTQAQNDLHSIRTSASANKTNAELAMQQSADSLTKAQASYATAKENWEYVQAAGADPTNPNVIDPATGKKSTNKLNDVQKRQYYEAFIQAEATVRSAEKALAQAQVSYDKARQDEITQIQQAEAAFADTQQQLNALNNPNASDLIQAQASVDQARANLEKLQQGGTKADIDAAQANLEQAQANLEQIIAPPRAVDLAEAQGRITAAQVAVQQAERNLEQATLRAPFAGIIAERHLEVGQRMSSGIGGSPAAPFVLADIGTWTIETDNLNERNVVRFQAGSPAQITFDAIPDTTLTGHVTMIQPRGIDQYGDITYTVTIAPDTWDARLRWNMSASVTIATK
jgi:HlyD family secretion protein